MGSFRRCLTVGLWREPLRLLRSKCVTLAVVWMVVSGPSGPRSPVHPAASFTGTHTLAGGYAGVVRFFHLRVHHAVYLDLQRTGHPGASLAPVIIACPRCRAQYLADEALDYEGIEGEADTWEGSAVLAAE